MRKLIFQMMVSLDGFFEGPNKELDWHVWDEEMNEYANELLNSADTLLFGRVTYELMAAFWPTPAANIEDQGVANKMNRLPKFVFSKTLSLVDWNNSTLIKEDAAEEITKLKQQQGKDMVIFGSSSFVTSLIAFNLIDEYQIIINPVVLCRGRQLLVGVNHKLKLQLLDTRVFRCGNVLLNYKLDINK